MKRVFQKVLQFINKYNKIIFPFVVIAVVAFTVLIALHFLDVKQDKVEQLGQSITEAADESSAELVMSSVPETVPLELNQDPVINSLVISYYNALALGDIETIKAVTDITDDKELILIQEKSKYVDHYPVLDVYSKPGYDENSCVIYVYSKTVFNNVDAEFPGYRTYYISTREDGTFYIKSIFTNEESEYISQVSAEDDVVELNNRVVVEYNNLMDQYPEYLSFLDEVTAQVEKDAGVLLSKLHGDAEVEEAEPSVTESEQEQPQEVQEEPEEIILYAKATATVNVRTSDSEKADKIGKVTKGTQLQLLEQKANGWSKVLYEKKEGYIKSEYLKLMDTTSGLNPIGQVEATTTVNVRSQASETADKLGALSKGTSVSLYARENGWCKIDFNGQVGYVKEEYTE